jgi:hypothetical protein
MSCIAGRFTELIPINVKSRGVHQYNYLYIITDLNLMFCLKVSYIEIRFQIMKFL